MSYEPDVDDDLLNEDDDDICFVCGEHFANCFCGDEDEGFEPLDDE